MSQTTRTLETLLAGFRTRRDRFHRFRHETDVPRKVALAVGVADSANERPVYVLGRSLS